MAKVYYALLSSLKLLRNNELSGQNGSRELDSQKGCIAYIMEKPVAQLCAVSWCNLLHLQKIVKFTINMIVLRGINPFVKVQILTALSNT